MRDKILLPILILSSCAALTGCGGSGASSTGTKGVSVFQGTWNGSEVYVQGTFANPLQLENLGPTSLVIDSSGNIQGTATDALTKTVFTLTGSVTMDTPTTGTGTIMGLPGPFNTPSSPNLDIGGNFKLSASFTAMTVALGNSFGECTMTFGVPGAMDSQYAGTFSGTVTSSAGSGTVSSFAVDSQGNVTGTYTVNGVTSTISGTISQEDVATITLTPPGGGSPTELTGAAALTGTNGGMTVYLTSGGSSTSETINLVSSPAP